MSKAVAKIDPLLLPLRDRLDAVRASTHASHAEAILAARKYIDDRIVEHVAHRTVQALDALLAD